MASSKPTVLQRLSLYDIALEGKQIEDILVEGDGELTPETEERLNQLLLQGTPKIEGACLIIKELERSEDVAKEEVKRLQARRTSFERNADNLKARVVVALDTPAYNGKVKTERITTWTQRTADRIEVEFLAQEDTLENLYSTRPDLVQREYTYTLDVDAVKRIWEEERPAREEYDRLAFEYAQFAAAAEAGELPASVVPEEPQEPQSAIPAVVAITMVEGRRFLQIP